LKNKNKEVYDIIKDSYSKINLKTYQIQLYLTDNPFFAFDINNMIKHTRYLFMKVNDMYKNIHINILIYSITELYGKVLRYNFFQHFIRYVSITSSNKSISINKYTMKRSQTGSFVVFGNNLYTLLLSELRGSITDITYKVFYEEVFSKAFEYLFSEYSSTVDIGQAKKLLREVILSLKDTISSYYY
jgi:hypothetical protein